MDPNYPITPQQMQQMQPKRFPKKLLLIGLVVLLVIIIAAVFMVMGKKDKDGSETQNTLDPSVYVVREGYKDMPDSIGDATAIFASLSNKVVSYSGTQVMQPCELVTLGDLKSNGLLLQANSLTGAITRNAYDGRGSQQQLPLSTILLPGIDDANSCQYFLKDKRTVDLAVLQPFNSTTQALDYEISKRYVAAPDVNGLKVFKKNRVNNLNKNESIYLIRGNNTTVELRTDVDEATKSKLLALTAANLKKAEATPTPLTTFSMKSPVMKDSVYMSCDILNDGAFKQATGVDAHPLTKEVFASSIGVMEDPATKKLYNYSSYDCTRRGIKNDAIFVIKTQTYESADIAETIFEIEQTPKALAQNIQTITPAVGDESYFGNPAELNNAFAFRKGRLIVHVTYEKPSGPRPASEERISTLRPILEAAAGNITGY